MSETRSKTTRAAPPGGVAAGGPRLGLALLVLATAQLMVVLDATIVNVALPHIQRALGFSGSGLEWVVNAYALAFGGLLLLGGRAGDLLGRRRMFIAGLLLFSAASLAGGFATSQAFLLAARAVQGVGGAITAPAALSLITNTFPEGPPRNRALSVYAAMSIAGGAIGLLGGGLLTTYASWRWVLFVNVPIGAAVALAAPRVLAETPRRRGRFDLPGAITGTGGVAALVYGLSSAATSPDGVSHWGDAKVVASLTAAAVLLAAFAVIETRSRNALLPVRLLRDRNRTGAYLSFAGVGIFVFGMFFFLTLFMQAVWGYSALKTGVAYLPFTAGLLVASGAVAQLVPRIGARPLLLAGSAASTGGLYWLSRISEHATYTSGVLGPTLVIGAGTALLFVTLSLVALNRVPEADSGVASSLLNTGQQAGGSIGLAVLGTVAWTVVANSAHAQAARAAAAAIRAGHPARPSPDALTAIYHHALATGFSRAFLATAAIMLLALIITIAAIRVKRAPSRSSPRRTASTATGRSTPPTGTPTGSRRSPPAPRSGRLIPARPRCVPGGLPAAGRGLRPGSVRASAPGGPGGSHPRAPTDSVRDGLPSYGSSHLIR
jgi:EmrB/QacA subfamily drug resistance transporter